jgi:ketosteroid isomerase-like protein
MGDLESSVRMFYERFGEGDMDGAASIYHEDVVTIEPGLGRAESLAEWRAYGEAFRRACPDAHMIVQTVVESGETVAVEARFAGTFTGPLSSPQGEVPPTGNAFELPFADFFRFRGGRVFEHHVYYDQLAFQSALGITPPPE